jgi:hypothetical protein
VWKSKQQQSVTLSSSEAEYVALSEAAKELKFVAQTLESIRIKVKYPITVFVDNVGAIFMAENATATKQTRHVHTRYRFVYEEVEDGRIIVRFVKTDKNLADPYTKNVSGLCLSNSRTRRSFVSGRVNYHQHAAYQRILKCQSR